MVVCFYITDVICGSLFLNFFSLSVFAVFLKAIIFIDSLIGVSEYFKGELELKHSDAWRSIWQDGRVDIKGDAEIAKVAYGSYYYIISSIPRTNDTDLSFVGLSPGDLAHGGLLKVLCICIVFEILIKVSIIKLFIVVFIFQVITRKSY